MLHERSAARCSPEWQGRRGRRLAPRQNITNVAVGERQIVLAVVVGAQIPIPARCAKNWASRPERFMTQVVPGWFLYSFAFGSHSKADQKIWLNFKVLTGAARGIRTPDPIITNDVLYQLSYCGLIRRP